MRKRVGGDDKERLDAHAEKIRSIEVSIQDSKVCEPPTIDLPTGFDYQLDEAVSASVQLDLLTIAGTLLDTSCVLWMSELGNGDGHNDLALHAVLAGPGLRCGPLSESGQRRTVATERARTNQLSVSILRGFGFDDTTFGWQADGVTAGPLPGLG